MRPVYVLGAGAHAWGRFPDKPQLQLALGGHRRRAGRRRPGSGATCRAWWRASSHFEGGMGWGLHARWCRRAANPASRPATSRGGCAASGIAIHSAWAMIASGQCDVVAPWAPSACPRVHPAPPGVPDDIADTDYLRWVAMGATNPAYWAMEMRRRMHDHGTRPEIAGAGLGADARQRHRQPARALPQGSAAWTRCWSRRW